MKQHATVTLAERIDALDRALERGRGLLAADQAAAATVVLDKARSRMRHGTEHTVVALAGSTGVGKSSLFNALVGADVSTVGVRRPTTGVAHAAVWGEGGDALLDWLGIGRRHHVGPDAGIVDGGAHQGLVLVDLPDFDSTEVANRSEVDRLIALVDAMIWITDPQKYADEAFHDGYVRPLAAHAAVMHFVVNKIDTVGVEERTALVADFRRRLVDDGIAAPDVHVTSVTGVEGLDDVDALLHRTVEARRVVVDRLVADLRGAGEALASGGSTDGVTSAARRDLVERLGRAAGADRAGDLVAAQHRKDARGAIGWPPVRVFERLRRRHPISELPRATASGVARSEIDLALRDVAEAAAGDLAAPWPGVLRTTTAARADALASQLTGSTQASAREATARPRWWTPFAWLQRVLALVAVAGIAWLLAVAALGGFFQLDTDPLLIDTPGLDWIPLPSLLVLGGFAVGLLLALIVRLPVGMAAARRGGRVRADLLRRIDALAGDTVIADIEEVLADRREVVDALSVVTH